MGDGDGDDDDGDEGFCCFKFELAAAVTLGFSNATLRRSMGSFVGRMSCERRARRVQSKPPEKRTATLAL